MTAHRQSIFVDSNVFIYLLSDDAVKANKAENIVTAGPVISVQVLNEIAHVMSRKLSFTATEIDEFLRAVRSKCRVVDLTPLHTDLALSIHNKHKLNFYDALIVAAALLADCSVLYSEDMHSGLTIAKQIKIVNPFSRSK